LKLQRKEVVRVDSIKNGYGKSLGIYQFAHLVEGFHVIASEKMPPMLIEDDNPQGVPLL